MSNSTKNMKVIADRKVYSEPIEIVASTSYTAGNVSIIETSFQIAHR